MKFYYDLHMHTGLSPCGDKDMTPNNIVNMALMKGLDVIAITDHNSIKNVKTIMSVAEGTNLTVIPGMEVESLEEVHLVCLFPSLEMAEKMAKLVYKNLPDLNNRADIFGEQLIYNKKDEIIATEPKMLVTATQISIEDIKKNVEKLDGVTIPAHIDRNSYSIISNLGFIPDELNFTTVEISKNVTIKEYLEKNPSVKKYKIISNSDAHYLGDISEKVNYIETNNGSIKSLISFFKKS